MIPQTSNRLLPTFIIPGAGKSGTSYVASILGHHPDIFVPLCKEPAFFSRDEKYGLYQKGLAHYEKSFTEYKGQSHIGEASTIYMYDPDSPGLIKSYIPRVKLIFVLRNPVERVYSNYWQEVKAGRDPGDFNTLLFQGHPRIREMIRISFYSELLQNYFREFAQSQILILLYDDLKEDAGAFFRKIYQFLDVDEIELDLDIKVNPAAVPRSKLISRLLRNQNLTQFVKSVAPSQAISPLKKGLENIRKHSLKKTVYSEMDPASRQYLINTFKTSIAELSEIINRDLSHWLQ